MRVESTYLAWFTDQVEGCDEIKEAIKTHPRFPAVWESYVECRRKRQQQAEWRQGQFSQPTVDTSATSCSVGRKQMTWRG